MQISIESIDDLLEEWEKLKLSTIPIPCSLSEALAFTRQKDTISDLSHKIRISRLENEHEAEEFYISHFIGEFEKFSQEYVYRILKSDKKVSKA